MARSRTIGHKTPVNAKYALGSAEEVSQRDKTGYQPEATAFQQIGPGDSTSNANEPPRVSKSGDLKFTKAP